VWHGAPARDDTQLFASRPSSRPLSYASGTSPSARGRRGAGVRSVLQTLYAGFAVRAFLVCHRCESEVPDGVERGAGATASCPGRAGVSTVSPTASTRSASGLRASRAFGPLRAISRRCAASATSWSRGPTPCPCRPSFRLATVAARWLARFEAKVAAGKRRERTLEAHRYHLERHLLPALGLRLMRAIDVEDVAELLTDVRPGAARRRPPPGRSRPCTASCGSRAATAGSSPIR
jgi:hypothetical protein